MRLKSNSRIGKINQITNTHYKISFFAQINNPIWISKPNDSNIFIKKPNVLMITDKEFNYKKIIPLLPQYILISSNTANPLIVPYLIDTSDPLILNHNQPTSPPRYKRVMIVQIKNISS